MWKVVRARDFRHSVALLRIVCFASVPGSSLPSSPLAPFSTLSLSLAGPYAQNLRLISSRVDQSVLFISLAFSVLVSMRSDSVGPSESLWQCHPEVQGKKMKGAHHNPVSSSCHCSGVARSDSKMSAKALYGEWLHCLLSVGVLYFIVCCFQGLPLYSHHNIILLCHISVAWVTTVCL